MLQRRLEAAEAGHRNDSDTAQRHLLDDDPGVRATALRALHRCDTLETDQIRAALADPEPTVRVAALELAVRHGNRLLTEMVASLDDENPQVAEAAAWACGEVLGARHDGADTTTDDQAAAWACGEVSGADHSHQGEQHPCASPDGGAGVALRDQADHKTGIYGNAAVVGELSRLATTHPDALCREAAVASLGAIGDPGGLEAVLAGTTDKPAVRRRAVISLSVFDGAAVTDALQRATTDPDRQVRAAAEEILRLRG